MQKLKEQKEQKEQKQKFDLNELINEYTKIVDDESKDIITRANAVTALGETGCVKVVPVILKVLEGEYNTKMKISALDALKNIGDSSAVKIITKKSYDFDPAIRSKAAYVLGYFDYNKSLEELLLDENQAEEIREISATAMGKSGDERYRSCLIKALTLYREPRVLKACICALAKFKDDELTRIALIDALNNENFEVKEAAIETLGHIGDDQSVVSALEEIAKESNLYSLRFKAEQALKEIKERHKLQEEFESLDFDYAQQKKKLEFLEEMYETYKQTSAEENQTLAAKLIAVAKEAESAKASQEKLSGEILKISTEFEECKNKLAKLKKKSIVKIVVLGVAGLAVGSVCSYLISSRIVKKFDKTEQFTAEITELKEAIKKHKNEIASQETYLKQSNKITKEFEKHRWAVLGDPVRKTLMKNVYTRFLEIEDLQIQKEEKLSLKQLALETAKLFSRKKLTPKQFDEATNKYA
ncbi:MAG: HEAT repeat domain-containing protein, partial [Elusimicrobiota bacterium]|nr:HEAT repeat domain-containing protein [Elusimicrobiota bacterium]